MRRAALLLALVPLVAAGVASSFAVGQTTETSPTSSSSDTGTVPDTTTTTPAPTKPPADMSIGVFRERRQALRATTHRVKIRKCRSHAGAHFRYPTWQIKPWRRAENLAYWRDRRARARAQSTRCWQLRDRTFHAALRYASQRFGVSYSWMHACGHDEGSDRMVWNGGVLDPGLRYYPHGPAGSSGAYGPGQFMLSTFVRMSDGAWRTRAKNVPRRYKRWNSNLGQALAMAYGFATGSSGEWTGAACN